MPNRELDWLCADFNCVIYILSAARILALRALGFSCVSEIEGLMTLLLIGVSVGVLSQTHSGMDVGHMHEAELRRMKFFTILSSIEW